MPRSSSIKPVGRYEFLLRVVLIAAVGHVLYLLQGRVGHGVPRVVVDYVPVLLGITWLSSVESRFKDIGWSRWYAFLYALVIVGLSALVNHFRSLDFPQWLAVMAVLQIPTALIRSKPGVGEPLSDSAGQDPKEGAKHSELIGPVGRFVFLLRVMLVAACWAALFQLVQRAGSELALSELGLIAVLFAVLWIFDVDGRFMDAGVPGSYSIYYQVTVPLVSILPFVLKVLTIPQALALFVMVQIPTILLRSKPENAAVLAWNASHEETLKKRRLRRIERGRNVPHDQRIFFTMCVVLIAVLWNSRYTWVGGANVKIEPLAVDLASCFLCFIWAVLVGMRLGESGLSRWHKETFLFLMAACLLPFAYKVIDFDQMLWLFVLLQIPLFFARSKPAVPEPLGKLPDPEASTDEEMRPDEEPNSSTQSISRPRRKPIGPGIFLRALLVLAFLWLVLIRLDEVSSQGPEMWFARLGYAFLGFLWFGLAGLRFSDAGLSEGLFPYSIAVSLASLLPLMFKLTNGYESLAIFIIVQVPTVLLRSKPQPADPAPESTAQEEGDECLRDPLEGILVRRTDGVSLTYPRRRSTAFTGRGSGGAKRVPRWRQ
jgi:uncharacterized membrane protein YhaH (DUF805 family)